MLYRLSKQTRKWRREKFARRNTRRLLSTIAEHLLVARDPDREVLPQLFSTLAADYGVDALFSYVVAEPSSDLTLGYCAGLSAEDAGRMSALVGQTICGSVAESCEAAQVADLQSSRDPRVGLLKEQGFRAFACEPLLVGQRMFGTLALATRRKDEFDSEELALFRAVSRLVAVARDRASTLAALEKSEARLRLALQGACAGVWEVSVADPQPYWSPEYRLIYGVPADEAASDAGWARRIHPEDLPRIRENIAVLLAGAQPEISQQFRILHPTRGTRWVLDLVRVKRDASGSAIGIGGVNFDITDRKIAEERLRSSEERYRMALEGGRLGTFDWNIETNEVTWDARTRSIFAVGGQDRIDFAKSMAFAHPEERASIETALRRAMDPDLAQPFDEEWRAVRADGSLRWVAARGQAVFEDYDAGRRARRIVGTVRDITVRKEAEWALARSEQRLRLSLDAAEMGTFEMDFGTGIASIDAQEARLLGLPPEVRQMEIAAVNSRIVPEDLATKAGSNREASLLGGHRKNEFRYRLPDGSERWLASFSRTWLDATNGAKRVIGVNFDITERKKAEEQQRLLVSELNHRVKNVLATVQAIANQTLRRAKTPEEFVSSFRGRLQALARSHALLTQSLWTGADLATLIRDQLALGPEPDARISLSGPDVFLAAQPAFHLGLVMHELGTNARKYGSLSTPEGKLVITWRIAEENNGDTFLDLLWSERDGPPVQKPATTGFGVTLIQSSLGPVDGGGVDLRFEEPGVVCKICLPLTVQSGALEAEPAKQDS